MGCLSVYSRNIRGASHLSHSLSAACDALYNLCTLELSLAVVATITDMEVVCLMLATPSIKKVQEVEEGRSKRKTTTTRGEEEDSGD